MYPRLPRFKRASIVRPLALTDRDREIIRQVHRQRFLCSWDIATLAGGSRQQILRRLQLLYHHNYLERPRCQLDYYHKGGSREMVYGLGDKGAALLNAEGISVFPARWSEKNRSVGRVQLEHWLLVANIMVAIEKSCQANGCRFIMGDDLVASGERPSFRWNLHLGGGVKLGLAPDRVFAIEYDRDGSSTRAFFFLEADRGTMPVNRKDLALTSMYRKFLAYEATWAQGIHRTRFGFHRFRVLTVTTSAMRVTSMIDACAHLKSGHGLFLFADRTILDDPAGILTALWQTGKSGEKGKILD